MAAVRMLKATYGLQGCRSHPPRAPGSETGRGLFHLRRAPRTLENGKVGVRREVGRPPHVALADGPPCLGWVRVETSPPHLSSGRCKNHINWGFYVSGRWRTPIILDDNREQQHLGVMPKKKDPPLSVAEQRRRFEELARKSGASASSKNFRHLIERVAKSQRANKQKT